MSNEERLNKLKEAEALIRQVEFSYPREHHIRKNLFSFVVNNFGHMGHMSSIKEMIKNDERR